MWSASCAETFPESESTFAMMLLVSHRGETVRAVREQTTLSPGDEW